MPKGFENPNIIKSELKRFPFNFNKGLLSAFDNFAWLSPKGQEAILEKIAALREAASPQELLEEARVLGKVYKVLEDYLVAKETEKRVSFSSPQTRPAEKDDRKVMAEVRKEFEEIEERLEAQRDIRGAKTPEEKWGMGAPIPSGHSRRGPGKPLNKEIDRGTVRRPEVFRDEVAAAPDAPLDAMAEDENSDELE